MQKIKLQREKRAYLAYYSELVRLRRAYFPKGFRNLAELDRELDMVETHLTTLELQLATTEVKFQLN